MSNGNVSFGRILRDARERQGIEVNEAARRLRIRPDIVRALEASDFSRIPPKGYARNMVNAYARFLGLNATDLTRMYLDEIYAYQVGRTKSSELGSGFDMPSSRVGASRSASRQSRTRQQSTRSSERTGSASRGTRGQSSRSSKAALTPSYQKSSLDARPIDNARYESRAIDRPSRGYNERGREVYDGRPDVYRHRSSLSANEAYGSGVPHRKRRSNVTLPNQPYGGAPSGIGHAILSKLPFTIGAVVLVVIVVLVVNFIFGSKQDSQSTNVTNLPVTGISDTSGNSANNTVTQTVTAIAPTSSTLTYQVKSGQAAYIEIYLDDASSPSVADTIAGPSTSSIDFTGAIKIVTANPDGIVVTVDGEEVTLADSDGDGVYEYSTNFADILAAWQKEHVTNKNTTSTSTTSSTSNTNTDSASE